MASKRILIIFIISSLLSCLIFQSEAQLRYGFYDRTCHDVEDIVRDEVRKGISRNKGLAAGLGCDGSVLIDSTPSNNAEKDSIVNNPSLRGFEIIDNAKARLERTCIVSCADILAFAARDSIDMTGGFGYRVPAGRRDGRISLALETLIELPPPTFNVDQLTQNFGRKGLTQEEMVTLSGAHTLGRSHCTSFSNRLYTFNSTTNQDPSLDSSYADQLKQQCPQGSTDPNLVVPMDPKTPTVTDVNYYQNIQVNHGLFTSDQTLISNRNTARQVNEFARRSILWKSKFAAAMVKMGQVDVITGIEGEIRLNCRHPRQL